MKKRVLLVQPAPLRAGGKIVKQDKLWIPGLTLPLISALTPPDVDLKIVYETIEDVPLDGAFDLVAISAMGSGLVRGIELAEAFRTRGVPVLAGGPMVTLAREMIAPYFDSLAVGEAEILWPIILRDLQAGHLKTRYASTALADLSTLPIPDYAILKDRRFGAFAPVQVGRGCIHACEFCSIHPFNHGTYRRRDVAMVLRDVDAAGACGKHRLLIIDDNIAAEPEYAGELFAALTGRQVTWMGQCNIADLAAHPHLIGLFRRSGCRVLNFGLESTRQANLDLSNKAFQSVADYGRWMAEVKKAGIAVSMEMILGMDHDTPEVFDEIIAFCLDNRIESPKFYILTPIPGTEWWNRVVREDRLLTSDWTRFTAGQTVFRPRGMTPEELNAGYWRVYEQLYSVRSILRRMRGASRPGWFFPLFLLAANFYYRSLVRRRITPGVV